uniref:X protein n=1 Tax=Penaeus monodon TaxID=6687 RepID=Q8MWC1_PENMO|nr:X protein [Penaeus monodon]
MKGAGAEAAPPPVSTAAGHLPPLSAGRVSRRPASLSRHLWLQYVSLCLLSDELIRPVRARVTDGLCPLVLINHPQGPSSPA